MTLSQQFLDDTIEQQATALIAALNGLNNTADIGVAVAFAYPNGKFDTVYPYGKANAAQPVDGDTIFAIGSLTKTFTASLLGNNVANNYWNVDDPVTRHLSGYLNGSSSTLDKITLKMLAQHMSGMPDHLKDPQWSYDLFFQQQPAVASPDLQQYWATYNDGGSNPAPGDCWQYSDTGFVTLGFALVPYGTTYLTQLQGILTGPQALGMPDTVTSYVGGNTIAVGHPTSDKHMLAPVSANDAPDLKSTANDTYTWVLGNLVAPETIPPTPLSKALTTASAPYPLGKKICRHGSTVFNMGLAWQYDPLPATTAHMIWKDGLTQTGGCSSWIGMIPAGQPRGPMGIAILVNGYNTIGDSSVIADWFGRGILQAIWNAAP